MNSKSRPQFVYSKEAHYLGHISELNLIFELLVFLLLHLKLSAFHQHTVDNFWDLRSPFSMRPAAMRCLLQSRVGKLLFARIATSGLLTFRQNLVTPWSKWMPNLFWFKKMMTCSILFGNEILKLIII